eukprot:TRINITY_DN48374_c0_g1_i1.p1 TRINITY_DN48374_c0_g1~~TRINITY_DN48374_c0_g1_i1.p1  ORF type:complete len:279 (-),score=0.04 TRINITY_DN48374_c0_g1_i1:78-914(-)
MARRVAKVKRSWHLLPCEELPDGVNTPLHEPMIWFSADQKRWLNDNHHAWFPPSEVAQLPAWVSQYEISRLLFGDKGLQHIQVVSAAIGNFVWAPELSNVHSTWAYNEPGFEIDGVHWYSVEHYFQCMKSKGMSDHAEALQAFQNTTDPFHAYQLGRKYGLSADWEQRKESVMYEGLLAKFRASADLRKILLSTKDHPLVQIKPDDECWGAGAYGKGKNLLGRLLGQVRSIVRQETEGLPQNVPTEEVGREGAGVDDEPARRMPHRLAHRPPSEGGTP